MTGSRPGEPAIRIRRIRRIHLVAVAILLASAFGLIGGGCGGSDTCPGPQLGILGGAVGLVLALALVIFALTDRASPLAVVDTVIAMPLVIVPFVPLLGGSYSIFTVVASILLVLVVVGAIFATDEVAANRRERIALGVALVVLGLVLLPVRSFEAGIAVPIALLVRLVVAGRHRPRPEPDPWITGTTSG